eukprot:Ihof_evm3s372 gene=Ihof_evmTU3s372
MTNTTNSIKTRFTNVRILRDHELVWGDLWIKDGKIIHAPSRSELTHVGYRTIDGNGLIIAPGFVELQLNGAYGIDFSDEKCTLEDVQEVGRRILKHGCTSFCPTLVSSHAKKYHTTLPRFQRYQGSPELGATVLGYHLEGPFISLAKKGAHDPNTLAFPSEGIKSLVERYGVLDNAIIVTIAPELPGAIDAIKGLKELGIIASIGHTSSNYKDALRGVEAGATMVTHLFNAMAPFHHRDPGVIGLLGGIDFRPHYGIIADGIHTHPTSIRIAYKAHPKGLTLVTDAMAAMGLPEGRHKLGDMDVDVVGIKATIHGTDTLAGSAVDMISCVKKFRNFTGCSIPEVLECASLRPATLLGIQGRKGTLTPGADADFIFLNDKLD